MITFRNMVRCTLVGIVVLVLGLGTVSSPASASGAVSAGVSPDGDPRVTRLAGTDRFDTSAAISRESFAPGVAVAYVASAWGFPDALSGAPVAGMQGSPVLLVSADSIPAVIAEELTRLKPKRVVVLGGEGVVNGAVQTALASYTSGGVTRLAGTDRFDTSVAISKASFAPNAVWTVYLASASNFPDALAGAPAAGQGAGPILLVNKDSIPDVVRAELRRLNPKQVVALGGDGVISTETLMSINKFGENDWGVRRIGGADRFETSASISANAVSGSITPVVFIASGWDFPDALSGASAAVGASAPVLLVSTDSIPAAIGAELNRIKPQKIVILGGTGVVSVAVEKQLAGYLN